MEAFLVIFTKFLHENGPSMSRSLVVSLEDHSAHDVPGRVAPALCGN